MKKQLFLHVGMGKTGTTALQEFFWANREALAQAGVCYPEIGVEAGAHHRLCAHVPPELVTTGWSFLAPEQWIDAVLACPQPRILMSSELNSWATREEVAAFVETLAPHVDLQIIYYLRRPDNFVMADYNQQVKAGIELRSLEDALPEITRRADFPRKIAFWADLLGEEAMHLRVYERGAFKGGDIITDFLEEVLGIEDEGFVRLKGENSNPRLTPEALAYKRLLNCVLPDMRDSSHFIGPLADYAAAQDAGARGIYQDQALLDGAERQAILDLYAAPISDVARRYFGREDGTLFAEPLKPQPAAMIRPMAELAAEVSGWLAEHHPVEYAFLRAEVAEILAREQAADQPPAQGSGAGAGLGDPVAAQILSTSFGDAPAVVPSALLKPARELDQLRATYEAERDRIVRENAAALAKQAQDFTAQINGLRAGLSGAEGARDGLLGQLHAISGEHERVLSDMRAVQEAQTLAYGEQIAALRAGLSGAESARDALRLEIEDQAAAHEQMLAELQRRHAEAVEAALAEHAAVVAEKDAMIAKNESDIDFYAHAVAEARHAAQLAQTEVARLQADNEHLMQSFAQTNAQVAAMTASTSWRLTKPVRAVGNGARWGKSLPRRAWLQLNRDAQSGYRAIARRHPASANLMKRALWPILMAGNRKILKSNHLPMNLQDRGIKGPVRRLEFQRPRAAQSYAPLVSILVPNYNHAPYLTKRLESIYAQTYANVEVLLMDDCSSDNSREVLQGFADRYPDRTRILFNETNSGGVFFQWEKGLREAKGDLIWIAESDDWASENFLETLVPFFENQAVQLAYAPTVFMNGTGEEQVWSMDNCLAGLNPERWHQPFVETAPRIVAQAFGERNIVPNVSSAMFRKVDRLEVLENDLWRKMRTCGDWLFYINLIRGGCIAFSPEATNYYRLHDANTSRTSYAKDSFYQEHEVIAKALQRHYDVPWDVFERQDAALRDHWQRNRPDWDEAAFEACYSLSRIREARAARKPNLLMVGFAFCAGGGETFPIQLANLMKTAGYNVTFLDCAQEPEVPGVRAMLARDIPVVSSFEGLNHIVEQFDIDVIHSHHAWVDNTILDLLPEQTKAKTVVSLHGMYETIADADLKRILPRLVERTGKLIYTAEKNLGALTSHGLVQAGEIDRIDNALDRRPVTPIDRADLGIAPEAFVLTLVARALEEKGWLEAVEAVTRARKATGADIHLVLIGEGPAYEKLKARRASEFIHLLGFKSNIRDYFAASDMGFLPSRFKGESFPLVLIDCLNAGRPVLASTVGEIRYMLDTEDGPAGALFDLENWKIDVEALADQIGALATDPARMAQLVARVPAAAARFDPMLMRDRYDAAYLAAIDGSGTVGAARDARAAEPASAEEERDV